MNPGRLARESDDYRRLRDELHEAELALRDQRERVAELRRRLPRDTEIDDYTLQEGPRGLDEHAPIRDARLSELFEHPDRPLIVYQFMYGGAQESPCPSCTMWTDGFNGVARHLAQTVNFAVIAEAEASVFRAWGRERGWNRLRLVSSAGSSFKRDLGFATESGAQLPGLSVFTRDGGGIRHFYSVSALMGKGEYRGIDLFTPVWHCLDLTPDGRGDWDPSLDY